MRAVLEYPVDYMKRKQRALSHIPGNAEGFTKAYHDLEQYYLAMGLQDEGVVFIPMIERVLQEKDKYFLTNMLSHYIAQKEREDALSVMNLLWEEHNYAPGKTQQKRLAEWLAREDIKSGCTDPIGCLYDYVPVNPSFKTFKYYYKLTWVKESGSKFRHLSLFLKNKPADK
jgi:hypothetical protein